MQPSVTDCHYKEIASLRGENTYGAVVNKMREISRRSLPRMLDVDQRLFVYRLDRSDSGYTTSGLSRRYTAIVLIGLAMESDYSFSREVLHGLTLHNMCERLVAEIEKVDNLGDVALTLWAACACGFQKRAKILQRLREFKPEEKNYPTVDMSWALDALCLEDGKEVKELRALIAGRLLTLFNWSTGLFPHTLKNNTRGIRSHVTCFADLVYPIHALSSFHKIENSSEALDAASRCGNLICDLQGPEGQWWWHYDYRTGNVIENYPVFAVHQDAMAPMALLALEDAGGRNYFDAILKGIDWLLYSPEVKNSLIDSSADVIWRKVFRREPRRFCRYVQAAATRLNPKFKVPGLNEFFPPRKIDYETRPYHMGWLLYAWNKMRIVRWEKELSRLEKILPPQRK